jgi:flagellin-like protein
MKKYQIRKDIKCVSPVIGVILMVAITVVLAGVLWAAIDPDPPAPPGEHMSIMTSEKASFWLLEVVSTSGSKLALEDVKFQAVTEQGVREYEVSISDVNPSEFEIGESTIYPMTKGATIIDNTTNREIGSNSNFEDYSGCYIAFIDQDENEKISAGDTIILYKDYTGDGIQDITSNHSVKLIIDKQIALDKNL